MTRRSRELLEYAVRRIRPDGLVLSVGSNEQVVQLAPAEDAYEVQVHLQSPVGRITFTGREVRSCEMRTSPSHELSESARDKFVKERARLRGEMLVAILNGEFQLPTLDEVSLQVVERVSVQLMEVVDRARKEPDR